jgi:hypothetical protein
MAGTTPHKYCISITNADSCTIKIKFKAAFLSNSDSGREIVTDGSGAVNFKDMDPSTIKSGPYLVGADGVEDGGLGVLGESQSGGVGFRWPIDSPENATHLINAVTRLVVLCGGKKGQF